MIKRIFMLVIFFLPLYAYQESFISAGVLIKPNADLIGSLSKIGYPENIDPHKYHVSLIIFQIDVTHMPFGHQKKLARSIKKFLMRVTDQVLENHPHFYDISIPFSKFDIFKERNSQYLVATFNNNQQLQDVRNEIKEKFLSKFPSATTRHEFIPHISLAKYYIQDSLLIPELIDQIPDFQPVNVFVTVYIKKRAYSQHARSSGRVRHEEKRQNIPVNLVLKMILGVLSAIAAAIYYRRWMRN